MIVRKIKLLLIIILCLSLFSCASINRIGEKKGILQGMVYDYENRPIAGYIISIKNYGKTTTDINGRFMLDGIKYGTVEICGEGQNYSLYTDNFDFSDKTQILYLKIPSYEWLYTSIDTHIEKEEFSMAEKILSEFPAEEQKKSRYLFYKAIFDFRTTRGTEKSTILENLKVLKGKMK